MDRDALSLCHIHHIQDQNRWNFCPDKVRKHIKTALELRCIGHDKHQIRIPGGDVVAGDYLFI